MGGPARPQFAPAGSLQPWLSRALDPSLTADLAGQLEDDANSACRTGRWRSSDAAVRVASCRIDPGNIAVLSRLAADPDRGARLEPLGRVDRRHDGDRGVRGAVRHPV